MVGLLIWLLVILLIFGLIFYAIRMIPLPEPFGTVAQVVLLIILVLVLLDVVAGGRYIGIGRIP